MHSKNEWNDFDKKLPSLNLPKKKPNKKQTLQTQISKAENIIIYI